MIKGFQKRKCRLADDGRGEVFVLDGPSALARAALTFLVQSALTSSSKRVFNVAVSGGSTPRYMHRLLAGRPYVSDIPWGKFHFFWVDERCVPVNDKASNYGAARRDMFDDVPLADNQIHPMPGGMAPREGALSYEQELFAHFGLLPGEFPKFDLMILGVGRDGHTASLFPGQPALEEKRRLVLAVKGGQPYVNRLTLTLPVINQAEKILILISGKGKAQIVKRIFEEREGGLPIQRVQPVRGQLIWLLDQEAAALLENRI